MLRRLAVLTILTVTLITAGLPTITSALIELGLVGVAQRVRAEFLTGTAISAILALLVLLPRHTVVGPRLEAPARTCSVCENPLCEHARYCPNCGSCVTFSESRKSQQLQRLRQDR